ncbi:MAG: hypothetical protein ACXW5W_11190 [Candidatus Binatia bacterium]
MSVVLAGEVFFEPPTKIRIGNCPTREYLGLIFAYFGDGEAPPFPRYPHMEEDGILEILSTEIWPGNFFQRIDNNGGTYHVPFVHRGAYSASSANNRAGTSRKPARAGGRSDSGIILFRKIWERELRALAEGRPLKKWYLPQDAEIAFQQDSTKLLHSAPG